MRRKVLMQLVVPLLALCVLFLLMTAAPAQPPTELLEMSVILRESDSTAWSAARQGMEQAAGDLGVELRVLTLSRDGDAAEQRDLLARELSVGADAVILVPADREVLAEDVELASASAVIVTMETDMRDCGAAACVSVDDLALGETLGLAAINGAPEGARVLLLDSVPGTNGVRDRLDSAAAVLEAEGRRVTVCRPREDRTLADALVTDVQSLSPAAVVAFDAAALETAAETLQGLEDPPLLYGTGATSRVAAALEQGAVTALAAQNEFAAGYLAVEAAARGAREEMPLPVAPMEFTVVRQETMYEPENQKLLFPVTR